jgi:hypothetical protein
MPRSPTASAPNTGALTTDALEALTALEAPALAAAARIDQAFAQAGTSLARSLARAAADGKLSMAELAQAILSAANAAAVVQDTAVRNPVINLTLHGAGTETLIRSEAQIAQTLSRVLRSGGG